MTQAGRRYGVGRLGSFSRRMAAVLLTAALALGLLPSWAGASEAPEGAVDEAQAGLVDEGTWSPEGAGDAPGMALFFWPEGRRFFQLDRISVNGGFDQLKAFDLETREQVGGPTGKTLNDKNLTPPAWSLSDNEEKFSGNGRHHSAAVDREQGRVFVAYETGVKAATGAGDEAAGVASGEAPCVSFVPTANPFSGRRCVGGVHVIDGTSVEPLGRIRLSLPTVEGARAWTVPRALEYAPPVPERGWGGRALMLVEERSGNYAEGSFGQSNAPASSNTFPRRNSGAVVYAVAFDPESMRQEWAVRVEGCRNSREERNWQYEQLSHPMTVFRTGGADAALYVGCHGNPSQQGVVVRIPLDTDGIPASLPVRAGDPVAAADPGADDAGLGGLAELAPRQEVFSGPDKVRQILSDPESRRILMRVDDSGEVWWVFDGTTNQFIGTIGIGGFGLGHTAGGLDPDTGRLYLLAATPTEASLSGTGGLYVADIRRNPLPQALVYPHLADGKRSAGNLLNSQMAALVGRELSVQPRADGAVTRLFTTNATGNKATTRGTSFRVIADATPVSVDAERDDAGIVRTLDLDEAAGVTEATFDGTARGFGFRAILLGGVEGATRVGPADPVGAVRGVQQLEGGRDVAFGVGTESTVAGPLRPVVPPPDPCSDAQRELIVAFVGPRGSAVVDASSARGETQPVVADVRTREDATAPVTRCAPKDWPELWQTALVSQPPMSEPGVAWPFEDSRSSCTARGEATDGQSWSDPVLGMFSSQVECSEDQVGGWGQARGVNVDGVSVANTLSSFQIYRDPERGLVARVESIARGVDVGGVVKIDTIRGVAESWANGRTPTVTEEEDVEADDDVFNPWNCDRSRPAGTCFERHVFGVRVASPDGSQGYRCGPCGDEDALIEGMNRGFGAYGAARFREPDRDLARGSADGYVAAVTKKDAERFSDIVMNADLLETMVPMLEVIRYAPHARPSNEKFIDGGKDNDYYTLGTPPRGRQVYQFAAVEVSSTYSVQCLLVYHETTNTCAEAAEVPGSIQVSLSDPEGEPLAGGAFELRADVDADGVLGLKDTLLPDGACVTAEDGVGTCTFEGLAPGTYLVNQVAAPPGYAKSAEPWVSEVASGEQRVVAFTNVSNVSMIDMTVTDENGAPVSGAAFAAYPDPDADGKVAPDAEPAATCTTDEQGVCSMQVPAGSYVLVQTGAPGGLEGIEPVAFTFASGGQVAAVTVVNYPPEQPAAPEGVASPEIAYTAPVGYSPPVESIDDAYVPTDSVGAPAVAGPSVPEQIGGTVVRVIRAPGDALRLLSRDPQQAVAFTAALALLALALLAVRRRQLLGGLTAVPAFAFTGGGGGTPPTAPPRPRGPSGGGGPSTGRGGPSGDAGPSSGSGGSGRSGGSGPSRSSGGGPARNVDGEPSVTTASVAATAVLDPPAVAGAAPPMAGPVVAVAAVTAFAPLASVVRERLEADTRCELVAVVDSLKGLRALLAKSRPDVLIIDLALPTGMSEDICDLLPGLHPPERTVGLILPRRSVDALIMRGYKAGLGAMLDADEDLTNGQLAYAVRTVARGRVIYGPAVQSAMADRWPGQPQRGANVAGLTDREIEVAKLAATGMRRADIAEELFLSPDTVKGKLRAIRAKLGVTNPWDHALLRRRLEEIGIVEPGHDAPTDGGSTELT